jgi:ABC-type bacteriocin/lantibiotic exporter with double-glycine peptidase domain
MTAVSMPRRRRQRWFAPEVVQTSSMDCGPATLKCLLDGHGIPVGYGRLREACQTDVDGTSIDMLEEVANQLGVAVEQISIPVDHAFLPSAAALPALMVTRHRDGSLHFVIVWRRHGQWLQVMDPTIGRRWVRCRDFSEEIYRHTQGVSGEEWRSWAESEDGLGPLKQRLVAATGSDAHAGTLIDKSRAIPGWFGLGTLDAALRLVQSMISAGGIRRGRQASKMLEALFERTCRATAGKQETDETVDIYALISPHYWSVTPDPATTDPDHPKLQLHGAVMLRVLPAQIAASVSTAAGRAQDLSPELVAALREERPHPLRTLWQYLKLDGVLAPLALAGAIVLAAGAILVESLLFRGLFDMAQILAQPMQRLGAVLALLAFAAVLLMIQFPIILETARFGRHLETRLRMALLSKLPRLSDRYFHSRPVSDMAERSHSLQMIRGVPAMGLQLVQVASELVLTLVGIALIDLDSVALAASIAAVAIAFSAAAQPMINERDLRVRNHTGAMIGSYLDSLLGLVPIRTHAAQNAMSRQHEGLLVEWFRSSRGLIRMSLLSGAAQTLACTALAGWLLVDHFQRTGGVSGADLLLVYWVLKMPAIGRAITSLALSYPAQRNVLLRLLEPLSAPEHHDTRNDELDRTIADASHADTREKPQASDDSNGSPPGAGIEITGGHVIAAGHTILHDLDLTVSRGEHIAIVGRSGAGKSTLLGLLLGWHRLSAGFMTVDGKPLLAAELDQLRRRIAWVDPAIQLWNQSFVDNLTYACEFDELHKVGSIVDAAGLRSVIAKLPQGLQTLLGEGGALLSGGEGQRVRLARALMQSDVRLALLDEPFRGMDRGQRALLLNEVRAWWAGVTLLCVTHDVSETLGFDRVLVVEDGRILEDGLPKELAARPTRYRQLLEAESEVRETLWQGAQWRRLRLIEGRIESAVQ